MAFPDENLIEVAFESQPSLVAKPGMTILPSDGLKALEDILLDRPCQDESREGIDWLCRCDAWRSSVDSKPEYRLLTRALDLSSHSQFVIRLIMIFGVEFRQELAQVLSLDSTMDQELLHIIFAEH